MYTHITDNGMQVHGEFNVHVFIYQLIMFKYIMCMIF